MMSHRVATPPRPPLLLWRQMLQFRRRCSRRPAVAQQAQRRECGEQLGTSRYRAGQHSIISKSLEVGGCGGARSAAFVEAAHPASGPPRLWPTASPCQPPHGKKGKDATRLAHPASCSSSGSGRQWRRQAGGGTARRGAASHATGKQMAARLERSSTAAAGPRLRVKQLPPLLLRLRRHERSLVPAAFDGQESQGRRMSGAGEAGASLAFCPDSLRCCRAAAASRAFDTRVAPPLTASR